MRQRFVLCLMVIGLGASYTSLLAQDTLLKARYLMLPVDLIEDDQIFLTPAEYAKLRAEAGKIKQFYFATFDIIHSASDSLNSYKTLKKNTENFADNFQDTTLLFQNGAQLITLNSAASAPYMHKPIGATIAFIRDKELYVSKIIGKKQVADSLRARHILFLDMKAGEVDGIVRDLKNNKVSWEHVNNTHNKDYNSAKNNGDLGYFTQGRMVESFDKLCFEVAVVGTYYRVETQFGQHIVQVTDIKNSGAPNCLQTISFKAPLVISEKTIARVEAKAQKCIGKSKNIDALEKRLHKQGIKFEIQLFFPSSSEEVMAWVNDAKDGDITQKPIRMDGIFSNLDQMVISGLRVGPGSQISDDSLNKLYGYELRRWKKMELLVQSIQGYSTLESIAAQYDVPVKELVLPDSGPDSGADEMRSSERLRNSLFSFEPNKLTEPIIGYNGIYVAYVYWKR